VDQRALDARAKLGYVPVVRTSVRLGVMSVHWIKTGAPSAPILQKESPTVTIVYTPDQIKLMFRECADQDQLDRRLTALCGQYPTEQKLLQQFRSIGGQIRGTLPVKTVKESRDSGPKERTLKAQRPADLDPQMWQVWATLPVKTAQGNLSRWRTTLVQHDATGKTESVHGAYRKGADGKEYFYPAIKSTTPAAPRIKTTPADEIKAYRVATDKSGIELSSGAYDLLSRAERTIYAQAHIARLAVKKAARKAAQVATVASDKASVVATPAPVAPVVEPVKIVVPVVRGSLSFK
jgi:hypothetical protein